MNELRKVPNRQDQLYLDKYKDDLGFQKRAKAKRKLFNNIVKRLDKKSPLHNNMKLDYWNKFIINREGQIVIRCQAKDGTASNPPQQCLMRAIGGKLTCIPHGMNKENSKATKALKSIGKELGIYDIGDHHTLHKEMAEVENMPKEKLEHAEDELKLGIALLRRLMSTTTDDDLISKPTKLYWILNKLVEFKQANWEMKHGDKVSFSREQVEYVFTRVRTVITNIVKDHESLDKISSEILKIGFEVKSDGFKKK